MENKKINFNEPEWEIDNMTKHVRSKRWYIIAGIVTLLLIIWAIYERNYLFALVIIISTGLLIYYEGEEVKKIKVKIQYNGLFVGDNFYKFQSVSKFYIIYKPDENIKRLYIEFRNPLEPRLSIPLENENPIEIRDFLLQYLEEDLDKEDEPASEGMANILKL